MAILLGEPGPKRSSYAVARDLTIAQLEYHELLNGHRTARGGDAFICADRRGAECRADDDLVALGDKAMKVVPEIGEGP